MFLLLQGENAVALSSWLDDPVISVARGRIRNAESFYKFGYNSAITNSSETIWDGGGIYSFPASASALSVASTASGDTSLTVTLVGLDENYDELTETVTLDGTDATTAVTSNNSFLRIHRAFIAGSTVPTGNITMKIGAVTHAQITAGENQTLMLVYTVPAGHALYVKKGSISHGSDDKTAFMTGRLKTRAFGGVFRTQNVQNLNNAFLEFDWEVPLRVAEKTDIIADAICSKNQTNAVAATLQGVLIDER